MRRQVEPPVWLLIVGLIYCEPIHSVAGSFENKTTNVGNNRPRVFSPRMDYDEWTPLGRGNPLRNDPTYDYVPPVLDRVQYWLDSHTTESSSKRDILLLGATAKKTSAKLPEQYLNFANRQKFASNQETPTTYKKNYTNNPGPDPVKLRTTSFRNDVVDYRNQNRMPSVSGSYYSNSYYGQQSKPYTMMLPPPLVPNPLGDHSHLTYDHSSKDQSYEDSYQFSTQTETGPLLQVDSHLYDYPPKPYVPPHLQSQPSRLSYPQGTSKPTPKDTLVSHIETLKSYSPSPGLLNQKPEATTSSVSFEKSDLVYQSSQTLSGGWLVNDRRPAIPMGTDNNNREAYYQEIDHQTAGSSNHEVVIGQNANIIVQGESCGNDEVVIGHKEAAPSVPTSNGVSLTIAGSAEKEGDAGTIGEFASTSNMHIVLANAPPPETTDAAVALVMSTKYVDNNEESVMKKEEKSPSASMESEKLAALEMEKTGLEEKNSSFKNATGPSSVPIYLEDPPTLSPMRNVMPYHQPTTHHPPSGIFGGFPPQHIGHQQAIQNRPVQGMMHYGSNVHVDVGMGLRPPAPLAIRNLAVNVPDMHRRQPPNGMMTMEDQNQIRRPYQHPPMQSLMTTITSAGPPQIMTSMGMNAVKADQGVRQTDQRGSEVQTTFSPTPIAPTHVDGVFSAIEDSSVGHKPQSQLAILLQDEDTKRKISTSAPTSTTSSPIPITTVSSLTTDQIFSHYKQPEKPIRGPMYLIIQGHSKVKTYKPTAENHANGMEENEILDNTTIRPISKFEKIVNENTKSIAEKPVATKKSEDIKHKVERNSSGQDSLLSLLESGFSAFAMPPLGDLEEENSNSTIN